jgi:putative cell wall-binding protein
MLLVSEDTVRDVRDYIEDSIAYGGTVYLLGDADVVPDAVVKGIEGITVRRLGGETRLETNLNILQEAEITEREIIVCSGWSYADSLSASVLDRPVLLVGENLTAEQEAFLKSLSSNLKFYIIGGSSAVSNSVQAALSNYGTTMRVSGENRCETSANVARKFFTAPEAVVLIYSHDFAEGLCSIPLALSMKAPLILTNPNDAGYCMEYMEDLEIHNGVIVAGEDTVPDALVVNIFQLEDASEIKNN